MAAAEQALMSQLGWSGQGLISAVGAHPDDSSSSGSSGAAGSGSNGVGSGAGQAAAAAGIRKRPLQGTGGGNSAGSLGVLGNIFGSSGGPSSSSSTAPKSFVPSTKELPSSSASGTSSTNVRAAATSSTKSTRKGVVQQARTQDQQGQNQLAGRQQKGLDPKVVRDKVKLVALDMDGTLLDSSSRIPQSAVEAIRGVVAARRRDGVRVVLATGKARPAALAAARDAGLEGGWWFVAVCAQHAAVSVIDWGRVTRPMFFDM